MRAEYHQVCCAVSLAEDLSCAPQELLADGGALQQQRAYEENSWWFWTVDWWVRGRRSTKSVTDMITIMTESINSAINAT